MSNDNNEELKTMSQLFGLFSNQKEAGKAVEALAANLDESAIHTMNKRNTNAQTPPTVVPTSTNLPTGGNYPLITNAADIELDNLDDGLKAFFRRGLKRGGVVVAVKPSDEAAYKDAERILKEKGGQVLGVVA
jgi:poly-gamma-glutamate capsule biosynthesis protein CapA/YwtB (metallophosphatase superfamily)